MIPIFPTSYFPPLPLMAAMLQHLAANSNREITLLIEQQETFPKQTLRNRTVIVSASGPMTLSVPIVRPEGNHTTTKTIGISYAEKWNIIHWRAIETAYNSSPFFLYYRDGIEEILSERHATLLELNCHLTEHLLKKMKVEAKIALTEDYLRDIPTMYDFRDKYSYKHPETMPDCPHYSQVFSDRMPFIANTGILDLLFNIGPEAKKYLLNYNLEKH